MNRNTRGMLVWLILVSILVFASYQILRPQKNQTYDLPFSEFLKLIEQGKVARVYIGKEWIEGEFTEPQYLPVQGRQVIESKPFGRFRTPRDPFSNYPLEEKLEKYGVTFYIEPSSHFPQWLSMLLSGLLPVVLFPVFGVANGKAVSSAYFNDIIFLFIGGFLLALAMQKWNLHKRIALKILMFTGTSPARILLGFMLATAFLSMWMSTISTSSPQRLK